MAFKTQVVLQLFFEHLNTHTERVNKSMPVLVNVLLNSHKQNEETEIHLQSRVSGTAHLDNVQATH